MSLTQSQPELAALPSPTVHRRRPVGTAPPVPRHALVRPTAPLPRRGPAGAVTPLLAVAAVVVLVVWRSGPGKVPNVIGFMGIAQQWPHYPVPPIQAYVLRQGLGQALFHGLGWNGTGHYLALHLAALLVSALVLAGWVVRRLGLDRGAVALCLLLVSPVTAVLLEWIGMYDAFSILAWVALLLSLRRGPLVQAAAAVLGGLQNFEQYAFSVLLLTLLPELCRGMGLRVRTVALAAGALVGKGVLEFYLRTDGAVTGSRADFLEDPAMRTMVLHTFLALAPVIVFSALSGLWVPVLHLLPQTWREASPSYRWRLAGAVAVVLGVGLITADHTRVMALVSFPAVVLLCMHLAGRERSVSGWLRKPDTWLVLLVFPVVVWAGQLLPAGMDLAAWGL